MMINIKKYFVRKMLNKWDVAAIQEISNLPPVYLISNETLGHMAIIFNPESAEGSDIMEDMVRFFGAAL